VSVADRCPVCTGIEIEDTVERTRLPAMQNYVHRTREAAVAAPAGRLTLALCRTCGFAWNRRFDSTLLVYDEGYDNAVPSVVMERYYREIVSHLRETYDLENGLVVDVGCGDGAFLRLLCEAVPSLRGLGVDPALDQVGHELDGRVTLVRDVFTESTITEQPALVVSRHVLEHMAEPVEFLRSIHDAVAPYGPCPCFVEVPELTSIIRNEAFWDFSYEHCNYFTTASAQQAFRRAGFGEITTRPAYGGQYLWIEASTGAGEDAPRPAPNGELVARLPAYAAAEDRSLTAARERLRELKRGGSTIAVWGMATKGVLFSLLTDPDVSLIDFCIDVNPNKQGSYVPLTGHVIGAPEVLRSHRGDRPLVVIVMNELYVAEIEELCGELGVTATFIGATGGVSRQPTGAGRESPAP